MTDLDKKFGAKRIIDTPVSESACTGAAVGASLAGMKPILVNTKLKLRNNEELTKEENAAYLTYFSVMLRARENQFYQFKIGMLDEDEWNAMLVSFKTLFKEPKHLEIWEFIKITFADDFVELVDDQITQSKIYG